VAATLAAAVSLTGCASATAATPVVTAIVDRPRPPPGSDPLTPEERLLALLTADNPGIERVAMSLAKLGDEVIRQEAGQRLAFLARAVLSKAWRPAGTGDDLRETALERARTEALGPLVAAMSHVGGRAVVALGFTLAEDAAAPREHRLLALQLLLRTIPPGDTEQRDRRAWIAARLPPEPRGVRPADLAPILQRAAAACLRKTLAKDPGLGAFHLRLTVRFASDGAVTSAAEGDAPEDLRRCVVSSADRFRATEGTELAPVFVLPFSFIRQ
jgi:hypothetical protein